MARSCHHLLVVTLWYMRNSLILAVIYWSVYVLFLLWLRHKEYIGIRLSLSCDCHTWMRHANPRTCIISVSVSWSNYWAQVRVRFSFRWLVLVALHLLSELKHRDKLAVIESCSCEWLLLNNLFALFLPWAAINHYRFWPDPLSFSSSRVHLNYPLLRAFILYLCENFVIARSPQPIVYQLMRLLSLMKRLVLLLFYWPTLLVSWLWIQRKNNFSRLDDVKWLFPRRVVLRSWALG